MLGIPDPGVWLVMILCILSALGCVVYGVKNWNSDGEVSEPAKESVWAKEEKKLEDEL